MKNQNKMRRFLLIPLVLLCCLLLFAACGEQSDGTKGPVVSAISISEGDKPQTVYAEGQELDLSKGKLNVTMESGAKETIALNAEGVTVTGYDKTKLGDQPLIISYGGKSISLTVSVYKRMTFSGYETEYFVGGTFDTDKGKVTIVKDDGTRINVRLNDNSISVVSFDSSVAGKGKLVTLRYKADGMEYTDTVPVNVYEIGNVKFTKPSKTSYGSHDQVLNLQGGYFMITAKDNEKLTKSIPLEMEMASGFDPSVVTKENKITPVSQTITITYAGNTYQYTITIFYSGVSVMQEAIDQLKNVDPMADEGISEAHGSVACEALQAYMDLTPAEQALLSKKDVEHVAKVGAVYGADHANELAKPFSKALNIVYGNISIVMDSTYADAVMVAEQLIDPENEFVLFNSFMLQLVENFKDVVLVDDKTIGAAVPAIPVATVQYAAEVLNFMVRIYDNLAVVPDEWTVESLEAYGDAVDSAVVNIGGFDSSLRSVMCEVVSQWRAKDDYLDIIYTYYYNYLRSMMMEELWNRIPLPGPLQELYGYMANAAAYVQTIQNNGSKVLWYDVTGFHYYCRFAVQKAQQIQEGDNQLYKDLYKAMDFDGLADTYLLYGSISYISFMGPVYDDAETVALMDMYLDILHEGLTSKNGIIDMEKNKEAFAALFDSFVSMTPGKQRSFLGTVFYLYGRESVSDGLVMSYADDQYRGMFVRVLVDYFEHFMPESTHGMIQEMLLVMENYLNAALYEDSMDKFCARMEALNASYAALSEKDKALFDQYMGNAYTKYNALYQLEKNETTVDMTQFNALFDELLQLMDEYTVAMGNLADPETGKINDGVLGVLIAIHERARGIANQLLTSGDQQIIALFSKYERTVAEENKLSMEEGYLNLRWAFVDVMHRVSFGFNTEDGGQDRVYGWEIYESSNLAMLMDYVSYVILMQNRGAANFDTAKVLAAMSALRSCAAQDANTLNAFYLLDGDMKYYAGLESFFGQVLTGDNAALGAKLLAVEKAFAAYRTSNKAEDLAAFEAAMAEAIALYASITDTENFTAYLAEMYNFYLEQYNALKQNA